MAETSDDKAIKGSDLEAVLNSVAGKIKGKQDALDIEIDVPNKALKFNNVSFTVTPAAT